MLDKVFAQDLALVGGWGSAAHLPVSFSLAETNPCQASDAKEDDDRFRDASQQHEDVSLEKNWPLPRRPGHSSAFVGRF